MDTNAVSALSAVAKHSSPTEIAAWLSLAAVVSAGVGRTYHAIVSGGGLRSLIGALWFGTNSPKENKNQNQ